MDAKKQQSSFFCYGRCLYTFVYLNMKAAKITPGYLGGFQQGEAEMLNQLIHAKSRRILAGFAVLLAAAIFTLAGCGTGNGGDDGMAIPAARPSSKPTRPIIPARQLPYLAMETW
jgi:hypothetical protein